MVNTRSLSHSSQNGRRELVLDIEDTLIEQKRPTVAELERRYKVEVSFADVNCFLVQDIFREKHGLDIGRPEIIDIHRALWAAGPSLLDPELPKRIARIRESYSISIVTATVADPQTVHAFLSRNNIEYDAFTRV